MAKLPPPKRIRSEDFSSDFQEDAGTIGYAINDFLQAVHDAIDKGKLNFDNINRTIKDFTVDLNESGEIIGDISINTSGVNGTVKGWNVIKAVNVNDPTTIPISQPYVDCTIKEGILTVNSISGLQNSSKYSIKIELIGS